MIFQGERPRVLDVERMRSANERRLVRGRWAQEEVDAILARAAVRARLMHELID